MAEPLRCVPEDTVVTGWDFSTTAVKCLVFDLEGNTLAEVRLPSDLWADATGAVELSLLQLEGQARASARAIAEQMREHGLLSRWRVGGISATHHTAGRIDRSRVPVRRAICWNDRTLAGYHARGLLRLGGQGRVRALIGGPWAVRYSLSHLVKDEEHLPREGWRRTWRMLPHGPLAAGYLTGNFDAISVSSAASTGIMDLRTGQWRREMLEALEDSEYRELAWKQLPRILGESEPVGPLSESLALELGLAAGHRPLIFPTSDDQQAGLIGGGAVDEGQMAVILGASAVVNSSSGHAPAGDDLDAMRLSWGPYLWMRCYQNGAQFLDRLVGEAPDWELLEREGEACPAGCGGVMVLPFATPELCLGVTEERIEWIPGRPDSMGTTFRAALEALAHLMALGVRAHEQNGQQIRRITVSGGIARSTLMCKILASVLGKPVQRLTSFEGPALGAAVTALAGYESHLRRQQGIEAPYRAADAVAKMVKLRDPVQPDPEWQKVYARTLSEFEARLEEVRKRGVQPTT